MMPYCRHVSIPINPPRWSPLLTSILKKSISDTESISSEPAAPFKLMCSQLCQHLVFGWGKGGVFPLCQHLVFGWGKSHFCSRQSGTLLLRRTMGISKGLRVSVLLNFNLVQLSWAQYDASKMFKANQLEIVLIN